MVFFPLLEATECVVFELKLGEGNVVLLLKKGDFQEREGDFGKGELSNLMCLQLLIYSL